jgi:peptide/nickel transport system permease protein
MLAYLVRRVLYAVLALWAVSVLSFFIIQLPAGDYVNAYIASLESLGEGGLPNDAAESIRETYGIDRPLPVQYFKWITRILFDFDFGISFQSTAPVSEIIGPRLLLTVVLALATVVFTWIIAIPIGIISAVKQYSVLDYVVTFLGFLGLAVPDFLLALVLLYVAFAWFDFSVGGLFSPEYVTAPWTLARIGDLGLHMIIPMIVLGTSGTAATIRIVRANLLDELRKPYVVAARAKGVPEWKLILKYPVRIAMNPVISLTAYILPFLISGSIIVSVVLALPTMGPVLLQSLLAQDMFLAGSIILLVGAMTIIGTLLSDILLVWADPRVRFEAQ